MMLYDFLMSPFADFAFMRRALAGATALSNRGVSHAAPHEPDG